LGKLADDMQRALAAEIGDAAGRVQGREWLHFAGPQLGVDRETAREAGVEIGRVVATLRGVLDREPAIARTWTAAEIEAASGEIAARYRRSLDPVRPPDLLIQIAEGCLISSEPTGTTHGTPYLYDRAVPLVFWGSGIQPGMDSTPAATVDVAPTLATQLGIRIPEQVDGRSLPLPRGEKGP
jgi:hypothetical protein